ncbi:hypothetical protein ABQ397_27925 [Serratia fonticola]|uniref:hypothetical protein n=1 Tax=Serratia fonticola TaxID=47917 RepID=UPI003AAC7C30
MNQRGLNQYTRAVMPAVYCPADAEWIQGQLEKFTASARRKIVTLYADIYQAAWDEEPVSFKQENRARHEANTRLRLYVTQRSRASMGLTEKAPEVTTERNQPESPLSNI